MKATKWLMGALIALSALSIGLTWFGNVNITKVGYTFADIIIILLSTRVLLEVVNNKK